MNVAVDSEKKRFKVSFKKLKKIKKRWIVLGVAAVLLLSFFLRPGGSAAADSRYRVVPVERRDITVSVNAASTASPLDSYAVLALVKGDVLEAPFEEGDVIQADAVLYEIDNKDADSVIRQSENALVSAQTGLEQSRLALENAQRSLGSTADLYSDMTFKSRCAGKVTKLYYKAGDTVAAGMVVAEVVDSATMILEVPFHAQNAANLTVGQSATVTVSATGDVLFGAVTEVSGAELVGVGGILTRQVSISVTNPGGLTETHTGTAVVGDYACSGPGRFVNNAAKTILARASGDIRTVHVKEGDLVSDGQAIMTLDTKDVDKQLSSAQNAVKNAELTVSSAEKSLENAEKGLLDANDSLDNYVIKSPIAGTVVEKNFKVGDTIDATSATTVMAVVYDLSALEVVLSIDELDISKIQIGQNVTITADALPGETYTGVVKRIGINGMASGGVTSYPVTVRITDFGRLLPGMNVTADIQIENAKNLLTIPLAAVSRGNTVLVADPAAKGDTDDGVPAGYRRIVVTLGRSDDEYIEVVSGLAETDSVAIDTSITTLMDMMTMTGPQG